MITEIEASIGKWVKQLRSDNGTEFLSAEFQDWLKLRGMIHEKSSLYYPEYYGKAKRLQKKTMDMSWCQMKIISKIHIDEKFWDGAMKAENFIWNKM